jgi:hypothetical protein
MEEHATTSDNRFKEVIRIIKMPPAERVYCGIGRSES